MSNPLARQVIEEIAAYRRSTGVPQYEIARRMQTTQSHVSDIESLKNDPTWPILHRYLNAVGMRIVLVPVVGDSPDTGDGGHAQHDH